MSYTCYLDGVEWPTPEKLTVKIKGQNETITLLNEGEINFLRVPGLTEIVVPFTLPMLSAARSPEYYLGILEKLKTDKRTTRFIMVRRSPNGRSLYDTNMKVSVEDYNIVEEAKEGLDVSVDVNLKQWRAYGTKTFTVEKPAAKKKKATVKKGDTLWAIASKYYGSGAQYTKIYKANTDKISNPNLIYTGQVFTIP